MYNVNTDWHHVNKSYYKCMTASCTFTKMNVFFLLIGLYRVYRTYIYFVDVIMQREKVYMFFQFFSVVDSKILSVNYVRS